MQDVRAYYTQDYHGENSIQQEEGSVHQQTGLQFREESSKMLHVKHTFVWYLNLGHFGGQIINTWRVLKCCAGEGWPDRVRYLEVLHIVKKERNTLHTIIQG